MSFNNGQDQTALIYAAKNNSTPRIVEELLEAGAEVNAQDEDGATALMYAARDAGLGVVDVLLDFNANVHDKDKKGHNALWYVKKSKDESKEEIEDKLAKKTLNLKRYIFKKAIDKLNPFKK